MRVAALVLLGSSAGLVVSMLLVPPVFEEEGISAFQLAIFVAPLLLVAAGFAFVGRGMVPEREAG